MIPPKTGSQPENSSSSLKQYQPIKAKHQIIKAKHQPIKAKHQIIKVKHQPIKAKHQIIKTKQRPIKGEPDLPVESVHKIVQCREINSKKTQTINQCKTKDNPFSESSRALPQDKTRSHRLNFSQFGIKEAGLDYQTVSTVARNYLSNLNFSQFGIKEAGLDYQIASTVDR
ncbi:hypothetical protein BKI52_28795 [marine bacterium AO1-C]|nr:hypothetical protein BKI52_28795 [marine bacterium AO1-C]